MKGRFALRNFRASVMTVRILRGSVELTALVTSVSIWAKLALAAARATAPSTTWVGQEVASGPSVASPEPLGAGADPVGPDDAWPEQAATAMAARTTRAGHEAR